MQRQERKQDLRERIRQQTLRTRDRLDAADRHQWSRRIRESLLTMPELKGARMVMVYVHFRSEVETGPLLDQWLAMKKVVAVPLTLVREKRLIAVEIRDPAAELVPGYCDIPEPRPDLVPARSLDPARIQAVIVPGSVFDRRGGRMGYGGGYYDRFLSIQAPAALRVGVAYEAQVVDVLDLQPHDQLLDFLVTEKTIYRFNRTTA